MNHMKVPSDTLSTPHTLLNDCYTERLLAQKGVTRALQPLQLATEREPNATLKCVDVNAAAGDQPGPRPRFQLAG